MDAKKAKEQFPLIIWETTEEFEQEYNKAEQKFQQIRNKLYSSGFKSTYLGSLRIDEDCEPEVWLNDKMPLMASYYCKNSKDALNYALTYGDTGWWNLKELENFANGQGPIFERAMWKLGYRHAKTNQTKWVRREKNDKFVYLANENKIEEITGDELERLEHLQISQNRNMGAGKTYDLCVGANGLIYVALMINPFEGSTTETLWKLGAQISDRGHIAKQQDGFYIDARNIQMSNQGGIHIKAIKPSSNYIECVWPVKTPAGKIYDLADDLVSKVRDLS
jgi:hypothetical protein